HAPTWAPPVRTRPRGRRRSVRAHVGAAVSRAHVGAAGPRAPTWARDRGRCRQWRAVEHGRLAILEPAPAPAPASAPAPAPAQDSFGEANRVLLVLVAIESLLLA